MVRRQYALLTEGGGLKEKASSNLGCTPEREGGKGMKRESGKK